MSHERILLLYLRPRSVVYCSSSVVTWTENGTDKQRRVAESVQLLTDVQTYRTDRNRRQLKVGSSLNWWQLCNYRPSLWRFRFLKTVACRLCVQVGWCANQYKWVWVWCLKTRGRVMLAQTRTRTSAGSSVFEFKKENLPPIQTGLLRALRDSQSPARLKWAGWWGGRRFKWGWWQACGEKNQQKRLDLWRSMRNVYIQSLILFKAVY